jgi:hypothetical protein
LRAEANYYPVGLPILKPRVWVNPYLHFDTLGDAFSTMCALLSKAGLSQVFEAARKIGPIGEQPGGGAFTSESDNAVESISSDTELLWLTVTLFFVGFLLFGAVFVSQAMVASLISGIQLKSGRALWTEEQKKWRGTKDLLSSLPYEYDPPGCPQGARAYVGSQFCYDFVADTPKGYKQPFESVMLLCVLANTVILAVPYYGCPRSLQSALELTNNVFIGVYLLEAAVVIIGWGKYPIEVSLSMRVPSKKPLTLWVPSIFSSTNPGRSEFLFDLIIVCLSLIDVLITLAGTAANLGVLQAFKALRIARVLKLLRRQQRLQSMVQGMILGFPSVLAAFLILLMLLYIFASMAKRFFDFVPYRKEVNPCANFDNVFRGMVQMFSLIAGSSYTDLQREISTRAPECHSRECGPAYTEFFFFTYEILSNYIVLPLFVATVVDSYMRGSQRQMAYLQPEDIEAYKQAWIVFDVPDPETHRRAGHLPFWKLRPFLEELHSAGSRLGFNIKKDDFHRKKYQAVQDDLRALKGPDDAQPVVRFYETAIILLIRSREPTKPFSAMDWELQDLCLGAARFTLQCL